MRVITPEQVENLERVAQRLANARRRNGSYPIFEDMNWLGETLSWAFRTIEAQAEKIEILTTRLEEGMKLVAEGTKIIDQLQEDKAAMVMKIEGKL